MSRGVLAGGVTAVVGGLWTVLTGLTDLGWLLGHTDIWYPIITTVARYIGPQVLPSIPWSLITTLAGLAFVLALLVRARRSKEKTNA